jgi:magnesium transporter
MASSDDSVPEPVSEKLETGPTDTPLPPHEAKEIVDEIKAVAESRGEDSEVIEKLDLEIPPTGPHPTVPTPEAEDDDHLSPDDLRDAWPLLDLDERADGLRVLEREDAEEFFISLSARDEATLILHFRPGQRRQWMRLLEPDDVADVIQEAGDEHKQTLLNLLDAPTRKEVLALLAYEEDEAGGLMSTRFARLRPNMTADEALLYLRRQARAALETIYVAYVVDADQMLLGVVSFRDLFGADPKTLVAEIMTTEVVRVTDEMDQETVSRIFAEHDLNVIPVVDKDGKMKGIVTVDDIVDVVQEEATEDIQKFGGLEALDLPYLQSTRREMFAKRGKWLALLLVGEMLTTIPLGFFEDKLHQVTLLALFLPLIVSGGGNSGSQASTLIIRAMALGQIRNADWWLVLRRELMMGLALGALLGAIACARVMVWSAAGAYSHDPAGEHIILVAATVALSVTGCVCWGTLSGAMLPFLLKKIGADPASASAPLVATIVDVSGIAIYLTVATLVLSGVLL